MCVSATTPQPQLRLSQRIQDELPVLGMAIILFVLCLVLMAQQGIYFGPEMILQNAWLYLVSAVLMLAMDAGWRVWRARPARPVVFLKDVYFSPQRRMQLLAGLPMLAILASFMPFYSKMKAMIPLFNNYTWDATFIAWDQALFFGYDGWHLLQPLFGHPVVTALLALVYQLWMLLIYPGCLYFAFYPIDRDIRRRFFFSFVLSWTLIGGAMATALASVGPCFLEPLVGNSHFAEQMAWLHEVNEQIPVMTLPVQQMLLDRFHADSRGLGSGITAMPSMHIALAFLYWLAIRRISQRAGWFFLAFLVAIFIGSVHLAYHYAVDGVVSIAVVLLIWWGSAALFKWWDRIANRTDPRHAGQGPATPAA